jgi:hypothetical protein
MTHWENESSLRRKNPQPCGKKLTLRRERIEFSQSPDPLSILLFGILIALLMAAVIQTARESQHAYLPMCLQQRSFLR